ncbi:MAG TPA: hypothetical protein VHB70_04945 [Parafilimonas sp.]|nr:hypothetical protein [Parafilimonas sp.]
MCYWSLYDYVAPWKTINPSITSFLSTRDATYNNADPSSWLNIVVLDEQLNPVITNNGNNSYYEQVGNARNFSSKDSTSHLLKALQLFEQLIQFHLNDVNPTALIDVNIERIQWAYNTITLENKDSLCEAALNDITNQLPDVPVAAEGWYLIADKYASAAQYKPLTDTANRYNYVKSKQLIENRLRAMPDSCFGNDEMKRLLDEISNPELNTQVESVNTANTPFRMLINYKNIDTTYARVLLQKDIDAALKKEGYEQWERYSYYKTSYNFSAILTANKRLPTALG